MSYRDTVQNSDAIYADDIDDVIMALGDLDAAAHERAAMLRGGAADESAGKGVEEVRAYVEAEDRADAEKRAALSKQLEELRAARHRVWQQMMVQHTRNMQARLNRAFVDVVSAKDADK